MKLIDAFSTRPKTKTTETSPAIPVLAAGINRGVRERNAADLAGNAAALTGVDSSPGLSRPRSAARPDGLIAVTNGSSTSNHQTKAVTGAPVGVI